MSPAPRPTTPNAGAPLWLCMLLLVVCLLSAGVFLVSMLGILAGLYDVF